jgi:hypothetical protein
MANALATANGEHFDGGMIPLSAFGGEAKASGASRSADAEGGQAAGKFVWLPRPGILDP